MRPSISRKSGFTLVEILVVIGIIAVLMGILIPVVLLMAQRSRIAAAKNAMHVITDAMEGYRSDFPSFPPDNKFGSGSTNPQAGSQALAYFLATRFTLGESHCGPYIDAKNSRFQGSPPALVSPLKNHLYLYANIFGTDGQVISYFIVDPGPDGKFGGTINTHPANGASPWQSDGSGDDADNIYSTTAK